MIEVLYNQILTIRICFVDNHSLKLKFADQVSKDGGGSTNLNWLEYKENSVDISKRRTPLGSFTENLPFVSLVFIYFSVLICGRSFTC